MRTLLLLLPINNASEEKRTKKLVCPVVCGFETNLPTTTTQRRNSQTDRHMGRSDWRIAMGRGKGGSPRPKKDKTERERERERRDFFQNFLGFNFFPFCICIRLQREREKKKERPSCFEMKGAKSRKNWNEIRCQKQTFLLFCTHARAREEINKRFFF